MVLKVTFMPMTVADRSSGDKVEQQGTGVFEQGGRS
jgi:hypothetical protein